MEIPNMTYEAVDNPSLLESYMNHSALRGEPLSRQTRPESYLDPSALRDKVKGRPEFYVSHSVMRDSAPHSQTRPESYVNPSSFQDGCADDTNYESLTDIRTKINLYEAPSQLKVKQPPLKPQANDLKDCSVCCLDKTKIAKIQHDLRKTKIFLMIFGLLLIVFFLLSITAVVLAVILSSPNTAKHNVSPIAPEAQVDQGINTEKQFSELHQILETLNTSLNGSFSELSNQIWQNLSHFVADMNAVKYTLNSQLSELQHQLNISLANISLLNNHSTRLQSQLFATQNRINTIEDQDTRVGVIQSDLQARFNMTQSNLTQLSHLFTYLQNQLSSTLGDVGSISGTVAQIQTQLATVEMNLNTMTLHINSVQTQLNTTQSSVTLVSSQVNSLQTSINSRLRTPVNLYQNCRQDKMSCHLSSIINDNRRAICTTGSLSFNITGFYTMDMRCEYMGASQLEVPSLQTNNGDTYKCQCSVVIPSSSGFDVLSSSQTYGSCTLVVTRCPLSQTIIT